MNPRQHTGLNPEPAKGEASGDLAFWLGIQAGAIPEAGGRSWWAFPCRRKPRLMIPRAAQFWPAALGLLSHSRRTRWLRRALPWLARFHRRPAWSARSGDCPLDRWLEPVLGAKPVHYAVYLGTPSVFAKQTVQCQDEAGRVMAYIKIPRGPRAQEAIRHERETLEMLATRMAGQDWFPRLLGHHQGLSAQSPPPSTAGAGVASCPQAAGALERLYRAFVRGIPWQESPVRGCLVEAAGACGAAGEDKITTILHLALCELDRRIGQSTVPHRFSHGDFLPWNTREQGDGAFLFDWEWSGWRLPFHDAYHFLVIPRLGAASADPAKHRILPASPEGKVFAAALAAEDDPAEGLWRLAFLAERLAFYSKSCLDGDDLPSKHGTVKDLIQLLEAALVAADPGPSSSIA